MKIIKSSAFSGFMQKNPLRSLRLGVRDNVTQSRKGRKGDLNREHAPIVVAFMQKNPLRSWRLGERNMSRKAAKVAKKRGLDRLEVFKGF